MPRLVQSTIRAWKVSRLSRSAQYVPALDYHKVEVVEDESNLKQKDKDGLAERGFLHVPSTNQHGGIVAEGPIRRDVTVNLIALRRLEGEHGDAMRRYLLGLALLAAVEPLDPFLRQGCMLVPDAETAPQWSVVNRDGTRDAVTIDPKKLLEWAQGQAKSWGIAASRSLTFDAKRAKDDMKKGLKK
ncbi:MAG: hypothetical protein R3F61_35630 [Myxococcota bacterium]